MRKTILALTVICALLMPAVGAVAEDAGVPAEKWIAVFDSEAKSDDKFLNDIEASEGGYVAVGMSERADQDADAIASATKTCDGIEKAVRNALEQAISE